MMDTEKAKGCFMDVQQLAEFLAVPKSWVYERTATGRIPFTKVGRYVRFWVPDVLEWLAGGADVR